MPAPQDYVAAHLPLLWTAKVPKVEGWYGIKRVGAVAPMPRVMFVKKGERTLGLGTMLYDGHYGCPLERCMRFSNQPVQLPVDPEPKRRADHG